MAGIFDNFSTLRMTPEELRQLQAIGTEVSSERTGPVLPRDQAVSQATRVSGLLGADPVATQEQSRTGRAPAGRTFYANTAGDVGTSVPKGSGTSGVYGSIAEAAPKAGGMGRVLGKALGPLGIAYDLANPEMLGDAELTPEQQAEQARGAVQNMAPQLRYDAALFGQDLSKRTLDAGLGRKEPVSLMDPQRPQANLFQQPPEEPAVTDTPAGPAVEASPSTVPQAQASVAADVETQRQGIETQMVSGLSSGEASRPAAARAVVEADLARTGKQMTPDEKLVATQEELTNMKQMDNSQVGKYISYALMAGGLLSAVLDKSGRAGDNFGAAFAKGVDQSLATGIANKKAEASQRKADTDLRLALAGLGIKQQSAETQARSVEQTGRYQQGQLGLGEERIAATRRGQDISAGSAAAGRAQSASQFERSLAGREQDRAARQAQADRTFELQQQRVQQGGEGLLIKAQDVANRDARAKERLAQPGPGPTVSDKAAKDIVSKFVDAQGFDVDAGAKSSLALQLQAEIKSNPQAAANPVQAMKKILMQSGAYSADTSDPFFGDPEPRFRQKKATQ